MTFPAALADEFFVPALVDDFPERAHVEQVLEEIVRQRARLVGEDADAIAVLRMGGDGAESAHPADQYGHFGDRQAEQVRPVDQHVLGLHRRLGLEVVAEPVGEGLQRLPALGVELIFARIAASGGDRNRDVVAAVLGRLLDRRRTAEHDGIGHRNAAAKLVELIEDLGQFFRIVDLPVP